MLEHPFAHNFSSNPGSSSDHEGEGAGGQGGVGDLVGRAGVPPVIPQAVLGGSSPVF